MENWKAIVRAEIRDAEKAIADARRYMENDLGAIERDVALLTASALQRAGVSVASTVRMADRRVAELEHAETEHTCATCKYGVDTTPYRECVRCMEAHSHVAWEPHRTWRDGPQI